MATLHYSHKLLKSTRILNLFIKSNWREWITTPKTCQVSIWTVFSVINISFSVNLFLKSGQIGQIFHKTDMCFITWPGKECMKYISNCDLCSCVHPVALDVFETIRIILRWITCAKLPIYIFINKCPCLSILMFPAWKFGWDERTAHIYFNTLSGIASKPLTVSINWQICIFIVFIWLSLKRSDFSLKKGYPT